ncbi:TatD family deoxyribonuclease [bacterium]|nr:MAG: TatD family deoxyribonuclease [bacterium]
MLIETHCHLHDRKAFPDPAAEIEAARAAGVARIVVIGTHPEDWIAAVEMAGAYDDVWAVVGWHPNYCADYDPATLPVLRAHLDHPKVLAIGETGLDNHWDYAPRDKQRAALHDHMRLAKELDMPVVFHAREAYSELLDILEAHYGSGHYIFHCFAGNREEAARAVALGGWIGVDGPVTYPKAEDLREVLRSVPLDRLVVETDSPYLAPVPFRGKPNRPVHVRHVAEGLAKALGLSIGETEDITTRNALAAFWPEERPDRRPESS